jgi:DNA-binding FadR family transcriptional regulator
MLKPHIFLPNRAVDLMLEETRDVVGSPKGLLPRSVLPDLTLTAVARQEFQLGRVEAPTRRRHGDSPQLKAKASEELLATLGRAPQSPSRVAAAITAEIAEGRLQQGDRLPTEMVLATRFGVSRSVVREAIAGLRSGGVVRSRQGLGTFVVSQRETATLRIDADLLSDLVVFRNVFELRAILEIRAAALAALRADEEQRASITEALDRMRKASNWLDDGVTADLDFHRCVAAASGNPYIATVVGFLAGQMRQSIMFMRHNQNRFAERLAAMNIAEHSAIHKALMKRDAHASALAMRAHIASAAKRLGYDLSPAAIEINLLG